MREKAIAQRKKKIVYKLNTTLIEKGWRPIHLAHRLAVDKGTVSHILNGTKEFSLTMLIKLEDALEIELLNV